MPAPSSDSAPASPSSAAAPRRALAFFLLGAAVGALGVLCTRPRAAAAPEPSCPFEETVRPDAAANPDAWVLDDVLPPAALPLSWSAALLRETAEGDDRRPVVRLEASRDLFGPWTGTEAPSGIELRHEGRPIAFTVEAPAESNDWLRLVVSEPVGPGLLELRIGKDFPVPDGLPAERDFTWSARFAPEAATIGRIEPVREPFTENNALRLFLARDDVAPEAIASNLVVEPAVGRLACLRDPDEDSWRGGARFAYLVDGAFRADARYALRFGTNELPSADGLRVRLVSTNAVAVSVPPPAGAFSWLDPAGEALGGAAPEESGLGFVGYRFPRLDVSLRRVLPQNLVAALQRRWQAQRTYTDWQTSWCENPRTRRIEPFAPAAAGVATNVVSLDDFALPGARRLEDGLWLVEAVASDPGDNRTEKERLRRLVLRSDMALTVRLLPHEANLWATRLSAGAPVTNATFRLYAANGALLAEAGGSADGLATVPLLPGARAPFLAVVSTPDGAYSFLELADRSRLDERPDRPAETFLEPGALDGFLTTDRGIYRHGERVHFEALVRTAEGAAPAPLPLVLELARPDGIIVRRTPLLTDERGRAEPAPSRHRRAAGAERGLFEDLPDDQPGGTWRALRLPGEDGATLARRTFRVEAFVPPRIRVSSEKRGAPILGVEGTVAVPVRSDYFFGAPAADLRAEAVLFAREEPFLPPGWDKARWRFGAPSRKVPETGGKVAAATLDASGAATLEAPLPRLHDAPAAALRLVAQATVFELGGRPVVASWSAPWHVYPFYLGVETPERVEAGAELRTRVRPVLPDGSAATNENAARVRATLCTLREDWVWEKAGGTWRWRRVRDVRPLGEPVVAAVDADGAAALRFALPPGDRSYLLRVEPADEWTDPAPCPLTEWAFATGDVREPAPEGPHRLSIAADEGPHAPGATAHLRLRAPFDGLALVTVQRDRILSQRLLRVEGGEAAFDLPLGADWAPGVEIAASLVRPVAPGEAWPEHRAYGALSLPVEDPAHRLAPTLAAPAAAPTPDGGWRVAVSASLPDGAAAQGAHATFFLVDQAVLDLTAEPVPDPAARFGRPRASGAELFDTFRNLLRLRGGPFAATAEIGGDAAGAVLGRRLQAARTRRFAPLARCVADVPFDETGAAAATFDLPAFSGQARVVCLAWTAAAAGAAAAPVRLAPDLVVEADGPRFLAPGDSAVLTLSLHSTRAEAADAIWSLRLDGEAATNGVAALAPKGSAVLRVPISVPADAAREELHAVFAAHAFGASHRAELVLPLRAPLPPADVTDSALVAPGAEAQLPAVPGGAAASFATLRIERDPFAAFDPTRRWLAEYPWRCLEQTVSRAFPLVVPGGLSAATRFLPDPEGELRGAVARVSSMLASDRFTMWPDTYDEIPSYGARAGLFLAEASAAGIELPPSTAAALRRALRRYAGMEARVGGVSAEAREKARAEWERAYSEARVCALLGLRTLGEPDRERESRLLDRGDRLSPSGRAALSLLLLRAGRPDDALALLRALEPGQDAAALSWALLAWSETDLPETPERLARLHADLLLARSPHAPSHWGSTEANALAVVAAQAASRRLGRPAGPADPAALRIETGDAVAAPFPALPEKGALEVPEAMRAAAAGPLRLRNEGDAPILVLRRLEGVADPAARTAATNGLAVARRYFTPDGEALDPARGFPCGATVVVELEIAPWPDPNAALDQVVVDERLPAGLEPLLASDPPRLPWIKEEEVRWIQHRDVRDDRVVLFGNSRGGPVRFHYAAQVVSEGAFALPPLRASEMYRPGVFGNTAAGTLLVRPPDP